MIIKYRKRFKTIDILFHVRIKISILMLNIVLLKSLRNCERRNKGNFTLESNLNKIMVCEGQH